MSSNTQTRQSSSTPAHTLGGAALLNAGARPTSAPLSVLIAEPMGAAASAKLGQFKPGEVNLSIVPDLKQSPADLTASVLNAMKGKTTDLLVVRGNCQVNQAFVESLSQQERPAFVLRAGTGMDNIDSAYLKAQKIGVQNTASVNTQSAGEHALALMLSASRKITTANAQVKAGVWDRQALTGSDLSGKTLGIVGVGRIGGIVGNAAKSIGMKVIGLLPPPQFRGGEKPAFLSDYVELDQLCEQSDVITLHVQLDDETRGMIGEAQLTKMAEKGPGILINTARGGIADEQAVLNALNDGRLSAAGFDVFVQDPAPEGSLSDQLAKHPNMIATPHVGGQTIQASERMGQAVVDKAREMSLQSAESAAV
ncbi:MAG: NAD(P)-dependent oxidoreductase [Limnobacter sp.]|nr:NAD(P)-dependent oxidoreductase [Limnobacter sp.]